MLLYVRRYVRTVLRTMLRTSRLCFLPMVLNQCVRCRGRSYAKHQPVSSLRMTICFRAEKLSQ
jgi:hypothetical protein